MTMPVLSILTASATAGDGPPAWVQFLPLVAMFAIMWFLFLRPQMRQQKDHKTKLEALKKGDNVLTGGGFLAKVVKVDGEYVDLDLGGNLKVRALKSTITDVIPPAGAVVAND
ncbi:MAG TPA: preprotein translocase subunit YajC [Novosphingobium sp.]|nr:preprotein translocase subunit YajC [Novosphingobium sp.]HZV10937.1 preprotein translocase subunit YajC [Novosphingobium sp.]